MKRKNVYGQPAEQFGRVLAVMTLESPRQAMFMETLLIEAMKRYAGKPEETLLAKWHHEAVYMREQAARKEWRGWEDEYPAERAIPFNNECEAGA